MTHPAAPSSGQRPSLPSGWPLPDRPAANRPILADVADNFDVLANTNKDLWEIFDILENYIEVEDEEPDDSPPRTFIGLPLVPGRRSGCASIPVFEQKKVVSLFVVLAWLGLALLGLYLLLCPARPDSAVSRRDHYRHDPDAGD